MIGGGAEGPMADGGDQSQIKGLESPSDEETSQILVEESKKSSTIQQ